MNKGRGAPGQVEEAKENVLIAMRSSELPKLEDGSEDLCNGQKSISCLQISRSSVIYQTGGGDSAITDMTIHKCKQK